MTNSFKFIIALLCFTSQLFSFPLTEPVESYYTVKAYGSPHFHLESLQLDHNAFVDLINEVNNKTIDRAFLIEVPNHLYSENFEKLRAAGFFHYYDYPENNSSVWCRSNGSGIPLVASHTFGARSIVYYKNNNEYYFLIVKDRYGYDEYEFPGGYVQPDDLAIIDAFEKGIYSTLNLDYRSPIEASISEVLEETHFDLSKYGYSSVNKTPLTIAQIYTKNTRPSLGIHSINDCCQYLLFEVLPNNDSLKKQDHEILDIRWASYSDIIHDAILSPIDIHSVTDNAKVLIQRVVIIDKYHEARNKLSLINNEIESLLCSSDYELSNLLTLIQKQISLDKEIQKLEKKIRQSNIYANNTHITYFTPL